VKQLILLRIIPLFLSILFTLLMLCSAQAQERHLEPYQHTQESRQVKILTEPSGVYVFDQNGKVIGTTPNIMIECVHHPCRYFLIRSRDRFKDETRIGSSEGYADNLIEIKVDYFKDRNVYPESGKPIRLRLKKSGKDWLWCGISLPLIAVVAVMFIMMRKKRNALKDAPDGDGEPSTVTQLDLEGFGGQVGNIRGKRLVGRYGTYLVTGVMGEGGMSIVYEARRENSDKADANQSCAVKVLLPSISRSEEFKTRFQREIEVYHRLAHPSIVQTYDWGDEDGVLFIVMEKIEGKPLADVMKEGRPSMRKSILWTLQILRALGFAHDRRIVHRDIKPSNIFITLGENIKVLDFGIARALDAKTITATDVALGTPQYLPPEQIDSKSVDERADLYSLGVLFYQLLTGELPFQGGTTIELIIKQMSETPRPPSELNAEIPAGVEKVVMKLMEKKPEDRYNTAREAAEALGSAALMADIISEDDMKKILH